MNNVLKDAADIIDAIVSNAVEANVHVMALTPEPNKFILGVNVEFTLPDTIAAIVCPVSKEQDSDEEGHPNSNAAR